MHFPQEFRCGWKVREVDGLVIGVEVITSPSPHRVVTQGLGQLGLGLADLFAEHNELSVVAPIGADHVSCVQFPGPLADLPSDAREPIAYTALVGSHDLFTVVRYMMEIEKLLRRLIDEYILATRLNADELIMHVPLVEVIIPDDGSGQYSLRNSNVMRLRPRVELRRDKVMPQFGIWGFHPTFPLMQWAHTLVPTMVSTMIIEHITGAHFVAGSDAIH